jgi:hypothetical protein
MKVRDESEIMKGKGKWLEFADEGKNGLKDWVQCQYQVFG